ncbi:four helix bundle protein [Patescibacteria group bacterium]|nr:four helix bundle protein [Patescibacteria group bacterium]
MNNFHDQKLWQDAFVVLMEIHDIFDDMREGASEEMVEDVIGSATDVTAKIADGLSRADRRFGRQVLLDAIGMVAMVRTHLAVAWGRGLVSDEQFRSMDDKYATLSENLQRSR